MTRSQGTPSVQELFLSEMVAEPNRYHLYISHACPFSHRVHLVQSLLGLEDALDVTSVAARRHDQGWEFDEHDQDPLLKDVTLLSSLYERSRPGFAGNQSVPVLWDRQQNRIVHNDSAELALQMATRLLPLAKTPIDLVPDRSSCDIVELNQWLHTNINRMVYHMGFAPDQASYDEAYKQFFAAMDTLELRLRKQPYLVGGKLSLSDLFLLPTLIRYEAVYYVHFKANHKTLAEYPALYQYLVRLTQIPAIYSTIDMAHIKLHYYYSHNHINPTRIVPQGPALSWLN
ncbi:glutathione S-transferase C-terminal domain-containing protein [Pseudomonas maumuensis]|uniref:Glutathione S-transferase C-terminal domain-containing protein n=1 Tax=Pseudomonas maumuensis TaxID=2842354 RepID=A0ABX8NQ53_9PSED|nr:glutathione S-transferase C-terminal domain-containing protein [Pseudomonas maumuensis]QXH58171.1 glutathione S-transferase C-terminal domain-containing protein [Pseudomonas maumuensis]